MQFLTHLGKDVEMRSAERPARCARVRIFHVM